LPLTNVKIADVSGSIATSYATKLLADYGASVVNFEGDGFPTRDLAPFLPNSSTSAMHGFLQQNKASVRGTASHDALEQFDVVFYDSQTAVDVPSTTNTSAISWFGKHGAYADYQGSDAIVQALIGLMRGIGEEDGPPTIPSGYEAQILGGLTAYIGTLGHLLGQNLGNHEERFHLDTSIVEANLCLTEVGIVAAHNTGMTAPRMGINRFPPTYPLGIFPCKDGWLGVTVLTPSQWQAFCTLLQMEEFLHEPKYHSSLARLADREIIEPVMRKRLTERSAEELFYAGQKARIPLARVPTMEELLSVDQFVERRAFSNVEHGDTVYKVPTVPFRLFETPPSFGGQVAAFGEQDKDWQTWRIC
jgi:crotonobetainyl-CoA:carnitine CoA-transferase CaiB-like acyl-CoA transferase